MNIKSKYYQMPKKEFDEYLEELKNSPQATFFLKDSSQPYFFVPNNEINLKLVNLNKLQFEFDQLMDSFSSFGKKQLIQSFFLEEIEATNSIENIFSTRQDIFFAFHQIKNSQNKKILSIVHYYEMLLNQKISYIKTKEDIRNIYDSLLAGAIEKEDLPDGRIFRKGFVGVSDGMKFVHQGISGEESIEKAMDEYLSLYHSKEEVYQRMILAHFLLETIHPFYDGNGRLGRFLFSEGLFSETKSYFSFLIAKAFSDQKSKYYSSLEEARDVHSFGCLNSYVEENIDILQRELIEKINELKEKKKILSEIKLDSSLSKNYQKIYLLLSEASLLSDFGVSNEEIMKELNVSKRSLLYCLKELRSQKKIIDTTAGRITYHKLVL